MAAESARILFVSRVAEKAAKVLRSSGHQLRLETTIAGADAWLRLHRAELLVLDTEVGASDETDLGRLLTEAAPAMRVLVLSRARDTKDLRALFEQRPLSNFLGIGDDGEIDPLDLGATVAKILDQSHFGLDAYLAPGADVVRLELTGSDQKADAVDAAEAFGARHGCHPSAVQALATAVDEMVMNAFYHGPVDAHGHHLYGDRPRTEPVRLDGGLHVTLTLGHSGRKLGVAVLDPFGSIDAAGVAHQLRRKLVDGGLPRDQGIGAGLGLYSLLNLLHHLVINVAPGRQTEVIGMLETGKSFRKYASKAKSFNLFVTR